MHAIFHFFLTTYYCSLSLTFCYGIYTLSSFVVLPVLGWMCLSYWSLLHHLYQPHHSCSE
jgi:hypothetical protein